MKQEKRKIYYKDEKNDDFAKINHKEITIDENYNYFPKSYLGKGVSFLLYFGLAKPVLYIVTRLFQKIKIVGKKKLKSLKNKGYIIYCNHTRFCDAYVMQVRVTGKKRTYMVSGKDAFGLPVVKTLVKSLGAIPVPDGMRALVNMNKAMDTILKNKKALVIYPEAHIWNYYTGLRDFPVTSFKIAARNNVPVVPVATTFEKRSFLGKELKPKMIYNVFDPIYPKEELSVKENAEFLRDEVFNTIKAKVSSQDNYAYYEYIKVEEGEDKQIS